MQVSTRAVAKIIQAFDRLQQRNEKISKALNGELGNTYFVVPHEKFKINFNKSK